MRRMEGNPAHRIAEGIESIAPPTGDRLDIDTLLLDLLPGQDARRQVQLLVR